MKINPFRRRCPRNKRDRNSGNSALRSREADGMLTRRNPNATRLDDDGVEHTRSISGPVRAEVRGPRDGIVDQLRVQRFTGLSTLPLHRWLTIQVSWVSGSIV